MTAGDNEDFPAEFHRDRRQHGGAAQRLDDDRLAELTEEERVAAGLDAYDPDEVPQASDVPAEPDSVRSDVRNTEVYQEERAELRREIDNGEFRDPGPSDPFPPTSYKD